MVERVETHHKSVKPGLAIAVVSLTCLLATGCTAAPTPAPSPTPSVDAEWQERVDARWDALAEQYPDAARPEVELVRYVSKGKQSFDYWETCMHDAGWEQVSAANGKFTLGVVPEDQREALEVAMFVCESQYFVK